MFWCLNYSDVMYMKRESMTHMHYVAMLMAVVVKYSISFCLVTLVVCQTYSLLIGIVCFSFLCITEKFKSGQVVVTLCQHSLITWATQSYHVHAIVHAVQKQPWVRGWFKGSFNFSNIYTCMQKRDRKCILLHQMTTTVVFRTWVYTTEIKLIYVERGRWPVHQNAAKVSLTS